MKNKKKYIILIILTLIIFIGSSYAYFTSDVNSNGNGLTTVLTTTVGDITLTKSVSEISSNKLIPGESISMNFNVNNPNKVDTYFSLYWYDVTNTFVNKNDLKVSIIRITNNEEVSILSNAIFPSDEEPLLKGMLARAYTNEEYRLVVTYENTTSDQSADMNKSIKATIKPMLVDKLDVRITVEGTSRDIETGSDAKVSDLGTPESSNPNKVFIGWSTSENGDIVDEDSSVDPNETYYAVYGTKINIKISNESVVSNIDTLSTRNTIDDLDKPTKVGYNFKGWSKTPNGTVLANNTYLEANTTYYAVYEPITYEVKYNQGIATSGTLPSTQNATYDVSFNLGNNTMTKDNLVVDSYKVTYSNGDSSSGTLPSEQISKNTITYTADGWSTTSDGAKVYESNQSVSNLTTENNGTFNLYPYFTSSTTNGGVTLGTNSMSKSNTDSGVDVTINLNANGGSSTGDSDNKLYSNKYTTYTANGWTKTSGSTTRNYANGASTGALSANLTLYPCFSEGAVYDAVSLPTPTRSGYKFKGWSTNSSATSGITGTYTPTSDSAVTLYATWQASSAANKISSMLENNASDLYKDPYDNIRYYGTSPQNYVYFNCSDLNNQNDATCEKWRIIGVFDDVKKSLNSSNETRVKIMRDESLGNYLWDYSDNNINEGNGINQWGESGNYQGADLMQELNGDYLNTSLIGSANPIYWYGSNNEKNEVFDTSKILKASSQNMIDNAVWYTATNKVNEFNDYYAADWYTVERGNYTQQNASCSGSECNDSVTRTKSTTKKIGLIYPSDFAYAAGSECALNVKTTEYSKGDYGSNGYNCNDKVSWLIDDIYYLDYDNLKDLAMWTITPFASSSSANKVVIISGTEYEEEEDGYILDRIEYFGLLEKMSASSFNMEMSVKPTLYLKADVSIIGGDGSVNSPFKLII